MGAGVDQAIAVRWPATEEPALDSGLGSHGRTDSGLDPVAFSFADPAVETHHQVVGVGACIDRASYLGNPQSDLVVDEDREGEAELVAVEGSLRFADHDRVEPAYRVAERVEESGGFGSSFPGQRAGLSDVEELGDDLPTGGTDQLVGSGQLIGSGQLPGTDDSGSCWSSVETLP